MLQDRVSDCTFTRCKHQTIFLYYMSVEYTEGLFLMLWCPCYALVVMSKRWNQYNCSTLHRLYIWGHRWILVNICWLIQTFKYQCCRFQWHYKLILVYNLKTKGDFFFIKMSTLQNGSRNKFGLYVFLIFIGFEFCRYRLFIHCAKFEVHTCSIADVVTIPINACSSSFNRLKCCLTLFGECI